MRRVLVIGGANTDIFGVSAKTFVPYDSNPGSVRFSAGGVSCNIAQNLVRLGLETELITALGDDYPAQVLASGCRDAGISMEHALTLRETPGSVYLAVFDDGGDLMAAVSDMRALDALTPDTLEDILVDVRSPDAVVLDTNLSSEAIGSICTRFTAVPIFADCVSVAKAPRILASLGRLHGLHVNSLEAETLTGLSVAGEPDGAARAAARLHELGVERVFITEGPHGVFYSAFEERGRIEAPAVQIENVTGAGDAFMAGVVWGTLQDMRPGAAARAGVAAAAITLGSPLTVARELDAHSVTTLAEEILG